MVTVFSFVLAQPTVPRGRAASPPRWVSSLCPFIRNSLRCNRPVTQRSETEDIYPSEESSTDAQTHNAVVVCLDSPASNGADHHPERRRRHFPQSHVLKVVQRVSQAAFEYRN